MMFHQHVVDMQKTVDRIMLRPVRPSTVMILKEHAEHLGIPFKKSKSLYEDGDWKPPLPAGNYYGELVTVKFVHLFSAVRNAKGVDHPEYDSDRKTEITDENHDCEPEKGET
jgi:hypothetical protein